MNIPTKTLSNGFSMPVYGFGTWQMGGRSERDPANDDAADIRAIQSALDHGVTHIDTAEIYADGYTEELIARALHGYDRSKVFLVSKVQEKHQSYDDILAACERSLQRLQVDYLDLYLLHRHNLNIPLAESMRALDALVNDGRVKAIGVCNFTKEALEEAQSDTRNKIVCNQVHYNLMVRESERTGLLEYCQKNDVFLSAWRPVQKGAILDKPPAILMDMCTKYQKTPSQIAINWLISQPNVITLSKTRSIAHLEENLGALGWEMEHDDIEKLRREYPRQMDVSDAVALS